MVGGVLKTIGYFALFYFVMRAMRFLFEPKNSPKRFRNKTKNNKPSSGEFIDYEEVD